MMSNLYQMINCLQMFNFRKLSCAAAIMLFAASPAAASLMIFDFETEDDFVTPLENGQEVASPDEFGNVFLLSATGSGHVGASIFDSTPEVNESDEDLQTSLGNVLILQSPRHDDMAGDLFTDPNDSKFGGSVFFDFAPVGAVQLLQLTLIDIDEKAATDVILTDGSGRTRIYQVPNEWTLEADAQTPLLGSNVLDLTVLAAQAAEPGASGGPATASEDPGFNSDNVVLMEVAFSGSGALDDLQLQFIPEPSALILIGSAMLFLTRRVRRLA